MRGVVKQDNPHLSNTDISKLLASMWRDAPDDVRSEYIDRESEQREHYKVEMEDWRKRQEESLMAQRKQREQVALDVIAKGGGEEEIRKHKLFMANASAQKQQQQAGAYPPPVHHVPPGYPESREDPSRYYQPNAYYGASHQPPGYGYQYPPHYDMAPASAGPYHSHSWGPEASQPAPAPYVESRRLPGQDSSPPSHYAGYEGAPYYHHSGTGSPPTSMSSQHPPPTYDRGDPQAYYSGGHGYQGSYHGQPYYG